MLVLHCLMFAATFPFSIRSLNTVAFLGYKPVFLAHVHAVMSQTESVIVGIARIGL